MIDLNGGRLVNAIGIITCLYTLILSLLCLFISCIHLPRNIKKKSLRNWYFNDVLEKLNYLQFFVS